MADATSFEACDYAESLTGEILVTGGMSQVQEKLKHWRRNEREERETGRGKENASSHVRAVLIVMLLWQWPVEM